LAFTLFKKLRRVDGSVGYLAKGKALRPETATRVILSLVPGVAQGAKANTTMLQSLAFGNGTFVNANTALILFKLGLLLTRN